MSHYYTQNPTTEHDVKLIEATLRGRLMRFYTDSGVFSKAEVDYGSRVLIETMVVPPGASVLDMGCGWGPIGISAALLNPTGQILMVDVNQRALDLAARNAKLNGAANTSVLQSNAFTNLTDRTFDVVLTNPPIRAGKDIVFSIYEGAANHLNPGGSLWVVIQKKQGAPSTQKKLNELFSSVHIRERDKGYYIFEAIK